MFEPSNVRSIFNLRKGNFFYVLIKFFLILKKIKCLQTLCRSLISMYFNTSAKNSFFFKEYYVYLNLYLLLQKLFILSLNVCFFQFILDSFLLNHRNLIHLMLQKMNQLESIFFFIFTFNETRLYSQYKDSQNDCFFYQNRR